MGLSLKKAWKGIKKGVKALAKGVKKAVKGIGKAFGKVMNKLGPIGSILAGVALSFALPGLGTWISGQWATFTAWSTTLTNPVLGPLMRGVAAVGNAVGSAYTAVKGAVGTLTDGLKNGFTDLLGPAKTAVTNAFDGGITKIADAINLSPESFVNASGTEILETTASMSNWKPVGDIMGSEGWDTLLGEAAKDTLASSGSQAALLAEQTAEFGLYGTEKTLESMGYGGINPASTYGTETAITTTAELEQQGLGQAQKLTNIGTKWDMTPADMYQSALTHQTQLTAQGINPFSQQGFGITEESFPIGRPMLDRGTAGIKNYLKDLDPFGSMETEAPTLPEQPEWEDRRKYGQTGLGAEGAMSWTVPNLDPRTQALLDNMSQSYRAYLRGLADRHSTAGE